MRNTLACALILAGCAADGAGPEGVHPSPASEERVVDFTLLDPEPEFDAVRARLSGVESLGTEAQLDELIVRAVAARPGQIVADVGCGGGRHALRVAEQVGASGRVHCRDLAEGLIAGLAERAREQGLANVDAQVSQPDDARLPAGGIDVILLADVYGMVVYQQGETKRAFLDSLFRSLRPGGLVVVCYVRSLRARRLDVAQATTADFTAAGFEAGRRLLFEDLPDRPLIMDFRRP